MYKVESIKDITKDQGTHLILKTEEQFDIHVRYRFGIILVTVNEEELYKRKLSTDFKESTISIADAIEYIETYLPEELLTFVNIKENGNNTTQK